MMKKWLLLKDIPILRLEYKLKLYPIYDQNQLNLIPYSWPKRLENHTLWRCTYLYSPYKGVPPPRYGTVMSSGVEVFRKNGLLQRSQDSVTGVWVMITLVGSVPEVACVILIVAGTGTTGCYTVSEMEPRLSFFRWKVSHTEPNCREPSQKESSLRIVTSSFPAMRQDHNENEVHACCIS